MLLNMMSNLQKAKIYKARFDKLSSIPNKSEKLKVLITKIEYIGLRFCLKHTLEERLKN